MRLIDADNAISVLEILADKCDNRVVQEQAIAVLKDVPTIEAEPIKHGHWIEGGYSIWCSECGGAWDNIWDFNYCPNCGTKMNERRENE